MPRIPWTQAIANVCAVPDFDQLSQSFEKVTLGLRETHHRLDGVIYEVDQARLQLGEVVDFTGGVEKRLRALDRHTRDLSRDVSNIASATRDLDGRLCRVERRVARLERRWRQDYVLVQVAPLRTPEAPDTQWSRLFRGCGVGDFGALAGSDPGKLYKEVQSLNAEEHIVDGPFEEEDIEAFVEAAKEAGQS